MGKILNNRALLVDTDVVVDYLRAVAEAVSFFETVDSPLLMSSITVAELFAGVREGKERQTLEEFLRAFEIVPVSDQLARDGGLLRRKFGKSHGVGLAQLVTLNRKHFPMLKDALLPYQKA